MKMNNMNHEAENILHSRGYHDGNVCDYDTVKEMLNEALGNTKKVYILTRKECVPEANQTEVTIVGVYNYKSEAELQSAEEREKIVAELEEDFDEEDIVVTHVGDLTLIDVCVDTKNYYLEISEFELNKIVNAFI